MATIPWSDIKNIPYDIEGLMEYYAGIVSGCEGKEFLEKKNTLGDVKVILNDTLLHEHDEQ